MATTCLKDKHKLDRIWKTW